MSADADRPSADTAGADYTERLTRLTGSRLKQVLDVQRPYRWNLRRLHLGRVLDVGCGIGRNLAALDASSVGIDHNAHSVEVAARETGRTAMTTDAFLASDLAQPGGFDALLLAHVAEHMPFDDARALLAEYAPFVRPGGAVLVICPQERGYTTDATHVNFLDGPDLEDLARAAGLEVDRRWSFPFPRVTGRVFTYNETCLLARVPRTAA